MADTTIKSTIVYLDQRPYTSMEVNVLPTTVEFRITEGNKIVLSYADALKLISALSDQLKGKS